MAERAEHAPDNAQHVAHGPVYRGAVGCGARTIIVTVWCLIAATVIVIAWNVAIAPLAHMPHMTLMQGMALALLVELIAYLFERGRNKSGSGSA